MSTGARSMSNVVPAVIVGIMACVCAASAYAAYNPPDNDSGETVQSQAGYEQRLGIADGTVVTEVDRDRLFEGDGERTEDRGFDIMAEARKESLALSKAKAAARAAGKQSRLERIHAKETQQIAKSNSSIMTVASIKGGAYFTFQIVFFLVVIAGIGAWYWRRRQE